MNLSDILGDIEDSGGPSFKLTIRTFTQIEPLWPAGKNGQPVSSVGRFSIIRESLLDELMLIGYVNIANGIGPISSVCPGYWIIVKYHDQFRRIKMGNTRDEFDRNLKRIPEWETAKQLFL